jgi:hypothetical protein
MDDRRLENSVARYGVLSASVACPCFVFFFSLTHAYLGHLIWVVMVAAAPL